MLESFLIWIRSFWQGSPDLDGCRGLRSNKWPTVRKHHLDKEPSCQWCGRKKLLEVHHVILFSVSPSMELSEANLITLCDSILGNCHFKHGHKGNWKMANPMIREECNSRKRGLSVV